MSALDNSLLQKHNVVYYGSDYDVYDIIDDFLQDNMSEKAFYIVDLGDVYRAYTQWTTLLPLVKPYYAIKCNPNPVLIEALSSLGANFDCASENEIKHVIEITKDPGRIIFANPCKMTSQIRYARANDVDLMTFDCEEELYKIKLYHPYAKLVLRIAVDETNSVCKFNKKYGCPLNQVEIILTIAKTLSLKVVGFSFHVGSGNKDPTAYAFALSECKKATEIASSLKISIEMIDIGGGFPGDDKDAFEAIAASINGALEEHFLSDEEYKHITFISEPGRYFVQKSHTLVLNIIGKKSTKNEHGEKTFIYYLNDGMYGSFNCIYYDHYTPTISPFNERDGQRYKSILFGPTCDSMDVINEDIELPELAVGEWIYVENFGAYTMAAASSFNGFKTTNCKYIVRSTP
jgi:ornithine decarboxylase